MYLQTSTTLAAQQARATDAWWQGKQYKHSINTAAHACIRANYVVMGLHSWLTHYGRKQRHPSTQRMSTYCTIKK
jgi:hypothetical protein